MTGRSDTGAADGVRDDHGVPADALDERTGVPGRSASLDALAAAVDERSVASVDGDVRGPLAVAIVGIDRFRSLRLLLGADAATRVLRRAATALAADRRPGEFVGRISGDEFLVLWRGAPEWIESRVEAVRSALSLVFAVEGMSVQVSASIGIVHPAAGDDAESTLDRAATALQLAKDRGGDRSVRFDDATRDRLRERARLEHAVRSGIEERELEVHYQPIVDAGTGYPVAVEALVRWRRDDELVLPGAFVPVAEEIGIIGHLGVDVLEQAVATAVRLRAAGWPDLRMSVNLSALQLDEFLVPRVRGILDHHGLPADALVLEITETALVPGTATDVLRDLAFIGVAIAVDDFGIGYANLGNLRRFPVASVLKVEGRFVSGLDHGDSADEAIVGAAIRLGHGLGMRVVAEGVETQRQVDRLQAMGCDGLQGFHFAMPVAPDDIDGVLAEVAEARGSH